MMNSRVWLWLELALLYIAMPFVFVFWLPTHFLFFALWIVGFYAWLVLCGKHKGTLATLWKPEAVTFDNLRPILLRFLCAVLLIAACTAIFEPTRFLQLPRERPELWLLIMVLYPLLSVVPQEVIYRGFFFNRYTALFRHERTMLAANAALFGFAHVVFLNWVAVLLCAAGGLLFGQTYQRTRSLALVWIEHALYGCFIFTIGLGYYFYHGTAEVAHNLMQHTHGG